MARMLALVLLMLVMSPPAAAASVAEAVAAALKTDPVYVARDARRLLSDRHSALLRSRIAQGRLRVFVAVLPPATSDREAARTARAIELSLNRRGVILVASGRRLSIRAMPAAGLSQLDASRILREALVATGGQETVYVLVDVIDRLDRALSEAFPIEVNPNVDVREPARPDRKSSSGLVMVAAGLAAVAYVRIARRLR